jgi:hypothetical protein
VPHAYRARVTGMSPFRLRALWLLAALVLLLRAGVPPGWMPQAEGGELRVALCSGSGPIELILGADGTYHRETPSRPARHDPCPFGLATPQALDLASAVAIEPPAYAAAPEPAPPAQRAAPARSHRALRPPSRGPPALA